MFSRFLVIFAKLIPAKRTSTQSRESKWTKKSYICFCGQNSKI